MLQHLLSIPAFRDAWPRITADNRGKKESMTGLSERTQAFDKMSWTRTGSGWSCICYRIPDNICTSMPVPSSVFGHPLETLQAVCTNALHLFHFHPMNLLGSFNQAPIVYTTIPQHEAHLVPGCLSAPRLVFFALPRILSAYSVPIARHVHSRLGPARIMPAQDLSEHLQVRRRSRPAGR